MSEQAVDDQIESEEVEVLEAEEVETVEEGAQAPEDDQTDTEAQEADTDEVQITIGEESPPSEDDGFDGPAPQWVKDLSKSKREADRENRELKQKLEQMERGEMPRDPGTKPTLADCDYDEEAFEQRLSAWHEAKREQEERKRKEDEQQQAARALWQSRLDAYGKEKSSLKVPDMDDAEASAMDALSVVQQGVIVSGAEKPAALMYALGKNPAKLKELAAIADPVKFTFAVARLETQLKIAPRKTAPAPERVVRGSGPSGGAVIDAKLQKLKADAERTGDYSAYFAAKRSAKG